VVPSRVLTETEEQDCPRTWPDLRIFYHERLLGLHIGMHITDEDLCSTPVREFIDILAKFDARREQMSLATRLVVVNVFLWTLFSFQDRHFLMPAHMARDVQRRVLRFLSPVTWCKLGLLAHLKQLHGLRIHLTDLRLANVASPLASFGRLVEVVRRTTTSLSTL